MNQNITLEEILSLMSTAARIMMEEGSLVEVDVPIKVVGDIHGQYHVSKTDHFLTLPDHFREWGLIYSFKIRSSSPHV